MKRFFCVMALVSALVGMSAKSAFAAADAPAYVINPGDVLQITVWKEDGLDREVLVLPDGSLQFPLAGNLMVGGKSVADVQALLTAKLSTVIKDVSVSVSVKAALGNAVDVIGQVNKPGELILSHRTTVIQALSIAGGLTPYASHGDIIVLHRDGDHEISIPFPYDDVIRGRDLDKDIVLSPGDVVIVPNAGLL